MFWGMVKLGGAYFRENQSGNENVPRKPENVGFS